MLLHCYTTGSRDESRSGHWDNTADVPSEEDNFLPKKAAKTNLMVLDFLCRSCGTSIDFEGNSSCGRGVVKEIKVM